jgi:cytochrome c oxidase assembly protein subunit 15
MFWTALSLVHPPQRSAGPALAPIRRLADLLVAAVFLMALTGALVAGIRAGYAYNTFPLMNGHVVPPEILMIEPWWKNFFYNMATVQFDHRLLAWLLALLAPALWWKLRRGAGIPARARTGGNVMLALVAVQIALGIATLLHGVPLPLAAAHQAGAVLVFAAALNVAHALREARAKQAVDGIAPT